MTKQQMKVELIAALALAGIGIAGLFTGTKIDSFILELISLVVAAIGLNWLQGVRFDLKANR